MNVGYGKTGATGGPTKLFRPGPWKTRRVVFAYSAGFAQKVLGTKVRALRSYQASGLPGSIAFEASKSRGG